MMAVRAHSLARQFPAADGLQRLVSLAALLAVGRLLRDPATLRPAFRLRAGLLARLGANQAGS